ncbi:MAG: hypothetical protein HZC25_08015 [Rhodospirillales bacterium]|nr:hypothetical protein [Rhodospirillales bacterium]
MVTSLRLKPRLIAAFLFVGLLPFVAIAALALNKTTAAPEAQAVAQLEAVRGIKKKQIETYFAERKGDMEVLVSIVDGMGRTGETYLVGPDKLMRSDSFLDKTNHSVKASFANPARGKVDTKASQAALARELDQEALTLRSEVERFLTSVRAV